MKQSTVYLISVLVAFVGMGIGSLLSGHPVTPLDLVGAIAFALVLTWLWIARKKRARPTSMACPTCYEGKLTLQPKTGMMNRGMVPPVRYYLWVCQRCRYRRFADAEGALPPAKQQ